MARHRNEGPIRVVPIEFVGQTILERGRNRCRSCETGRQHLFVDTATIRAYRYGTIFSVNSGTKDHAFSEEGEVHLNHAGSETRLRGGEQATTNAAIEKIAVKDKWRGAARLLAMRKRWPLSLPSTRSWGGLSARSSQFNAPLDLMPENTCLCGVAQSDFDHRWSHRIMQERINQMPPASMVGKEEVGIEAPTSIR